MRKWIIAAIVWTIFSALLFLVRPWQMIAEDKALRDRIEANLASRMRTQTTSAEPLVYITGGEIDPIPYELKDWGPETRIEKWPDWVRFYCDDVYFPYVHKSIPFVRYEDSKWVNPDDDAGYRTPFNLPLLLPGGNTLAILTVVFFVEFPAHISADFYDMEGHKFGHFEDLLGDYPNFSPDGRLFLVEFCDPLGWPPGPVMLNRVDGSNLLELSNERLANDLRRVAPECGEKSSLSLSETELIMVFSPDSQRFGVVVLGDKMPYLLVYSVKGRFQGAVRLKCLTPGALKAMAHTAIADSRLVPSKNGLFLTEMEDHSGLYRRADGLLCYRTWPNDELSAPVLLWSKPEQIVDLLGQPSEITAEEVPDAKTGRVAWTQQWVYRNPDGKETTRIEFLAWTNPGEPEPQDPGEIRSIWSVAGVCSQAYGVRVGDSLWRVRQLNDWPIRSNHTNYRYADYIIENGTVTAIHIHYATGPEDDQNTGDIGSP